MISIKEELAKYKSIYAAANATKVGAMQLHRLSDANALVDESGQVWIKSKTVLSDFKLNTQIGDNNG